LRADVSIENCQQYRKTADTLFAKEVVAMWCTTHAPHVRRRLLLAHEAGRDGVSGRLASRSLHGTGFLLELSVHNVASLSGDIAFVQRIFAGAAVVDDHATMMVNLELPRASVVKLSSATSLLAQVPNQRSTRTS
jgi:hypothetical protein